VLCLAPLIVLLFATLGERLVYFFAIWTNGELGRIPIGYPLLATQCLDRRACDSTFNDLVLLNIVSELLMIPIVKIRGSLFGEDAAEFF